MKEGKEREMSYLVKNEMEEKKGRKENHDVKQYLERKKGREKRIREGGKRV